MKSAVCSTAGRYELPADWKDACGKMEMKGTTHPVGLQEHDDRCRQPPFRGHHAQSLLGNPFRGASVSSPGGFPLAPAAKTQIEARPAASGAAAGRIQLGMRPDFPPGGAEIPATGIDRAGTAQPSRVDRPADRAVSAWRVRIASVALMSLLGLPILTGASQTRTGVGGFNRLNLATGPCDKHR